MLGFIISLLPTARKLATESASVVMRTAVS
jgi:hypothetical protein